MRDLSNLPPGVTDEMIERQCNGDVCDHCGEPGELTSVEDRDDSVGYHDTLRVCRECRENAGQPKQPWITSEANNEEENPF